MFLFMPIWLIFGSLYAVRILHGFFSHQCSILPSFYLSRLKVFSGEIQGLNHDGSLMFDISSRDFNFHVAQNFGLVFFLRFAKADF